MLPMLSKGKDVDDVEINNLHFYLFEDSHTALHMGSGTMCSVIY